MHRQEPSILIVFESSPNSFIRSAGLLRYLLMASGTRICIDAIVENPNFAVRHHFVDETNVYVLPTAVGIAQAQIDRGGRDLCFADAAPILTDLVRECLRTTTH